MTSQVDEVTGLTSIVVLDAAQRSSEYRPTAKLVDGNGKAVNFPNTDIQLTAFGYLGLNQWGRFRLEASARLRRELFSDFFFGLKGYESYDSEPPTAGAQKNDWGLSLSLGYSF